MNVRYALKWLRYQHFWRFVYRPVKPYDTGIYLYFGLPRSGKSTYAAKLAKKVWGDRIFEKCGIRRDEEGDGGKTLEIRGKRRLSARDGGANYQQS